MISDQLPVVSCPICGKEDFDVQDWSGLACHVDNAHWKVKDPLIHDDLGHNGIGEMMQKAHKEGKLKEFILEGMMEAAFR